MESFLKSWKAVSWEKVQIRVDEEIKAIGIRQDEGDVGRKILVDESNKYREITTKETRRVALPLIKAFQKEVDQLTVRGKATEAALIEICSQLTNLPGEAVFHERISNRTSVTLILSSWVFPAHLIFFTAYNWLAKFTLYSFFLSCSTPFL
ncbi:unnamed protein product [Haemonchus placei]|uniref:VHS domain-containing protein n=1 Tax=Haemonchus placei TaxID=6290 RepID=A0A0N4W103_HAEPC|nr:unnamed protein product [Haemonchus placei]